MRVLATGGIIGLATVLVSQSAGWIVGLAVGLTSVILAAVLWSSRQLLSRVLTMSSFWSSPRTAKRDPRRSGGRVAPVGGSIADEQRRVGGEEPQAEQHNRRQSIGCVPALEVGAEPQVRHVRD
jgi:hypothetical protein